MADEADSEAKRLRRRLERERAARKESERLAEQMTRNLYDYQTDLELINEVALSANEAATLGDTMGRVLSDLLDRTTWSQACAYRVEPHQTLRLIAQAPASGANGLRAHPHLAVREMLDSGRIRWHYPGTTNAGEPASAGVKAICAVPLTVAGQTEAVIELASTNPAVGEDTSEATLARIANHLSLLLARDRDRETIERLAYFDDLTGLPNKTLFNEHLGQALEAAKRYRRPLAVMVVDIDDFGDFNNAWGQATGDQLLRAIADALRALTRESEVLARHSGDEFMLLLEELDTPESAFHVAQRVQTALSELGLGEDSSLAVSATIGVSFHPDHGSTPETLLEKARMATHRAKSLGGNRIYVFQPSDQDQLARRVSLYQELNRAVQSGGAFELAYQPIRHLQDNRLAGTEALVRWPHPERGTISPGEFIPLLEESELVIPFGEWVLETACRQAAAWAAEQPELGNVAINIAPRQLLDNKLPSRVAAALKRAGLAPENLTLEVTERALVKESPEVMRIFEELRELGVRLALDDFGTGYSSLRSVQQFPFTKIKIDRSFITDLRLESKEAALIRTIVTLAEFMDLQVIAEGVETESDRTRLLSLGVSIAQGFGLGKPVPAYALSPAADSRSTGTPSAGA